MPISLPKNTTVGSFTEIVPTLTLRTVPSRFVKLPLNPTELLACARVTSSLKPSLSTAAGVSWKFEFEPVSESSGEILKTSFGQILLTPLEVVQSDGGIGKTRGLACHDEVVRSVAGRGRGCRSDQEPAFGCQTRDCWLRPANIPRRRAVVIRRIPGQSRHPFVTGWLPTTERIISPGRNLSATKRRSRVSSAL
jgi:hypothetical protein